MGTRGDPDVFERHLDLSPLHGRRHGKVHCPFHRPDRTPSFNVDLDRAIFFCHGCGVSGGYVRFAQLVGERLDDARAPATRDPLFEARVHVLDRARAASKWWDLYEMSDFVRHRMRELDAVRARATRDGDMDTLAKVARFESSVLGLEAELHERLGIRW